LKSQLLRLEQSPELNGSTHRKFTGKLHAVEDGTSAVARRLGTSILGRVSAVASGVAQIGHRQKLNVASALRDAAAGRLNLTGWS